MSSNMSYKLYDTTNSIHAIQSTVMSSNNNNDKKTRTEGDLTNVEKLSLFLRKRREQLEAQEGIRLSSYALANRTKGLVSHSTINSLLNLNSAGGSRITKSVEPDTIKGLAIALRIPEETLQDILFGRYQPPVAKDCPAPRLVTVSVQIDDTVKRFLEQDAERCERTLEAQVSAILKQYSKIANVNINDVSPLLPDHVQGNAVIIREIEDAELKSLMDQRGKKKSAPRRA